MPRALAQFGIAARRVEARGVDAAGPERQVGEAARLEHPGDGGGRAEGQGGAVVEPAQVAPGQGLQKAEAVAGQVLGEVGVVGADHRQREAPGRLQRRPAEGPLGGDVHQVRGEGGQALPQPPRGDEGEEYLAVEGEPDGGEAFRLAPFRQRQRLFIAGGQHQQPVAAGGERAGQALQGAGDAVDLRDPGFRDQGDAHRRAHCRVGKLTTNRLPAGSRASTRTSPRMTPARVWTM